MHDSGPVYFEFLSGVNDVLFEALNFFFEKFNVYFFALSWHFGGDAVLLDKFGFLIVHSVFIVLLFEQVGDLLWVVVPLDLRAVASLAVGFGGVTVVPWIAYLSVETHLLQTHLLEVLVRGWVAAVVLLHCSDRALMIKRLILFYYIFALL